MSLTSLEHLSGTTRGTQKPDRCHPSPRSHQQCHAPAAGQRNLGERLKLMAPKSLRPSWNWIESRPLTAFADVPPLRGRMAPSTIIRPLFPCAITTKRSRTEIRKGFLARHSGHSDSSEQFRWLRQDQDRVNVGLLVISQARFEVQVRGGRSCPAHRAVKAVAVDRRADLSRGDPSLGIGGEPVARGCAI